MAFTSRLLAFGLAAVSQVAAQPGPFSGAGQTAGSPAYNYMYQFPLPIPPVAQPELYGTMST